MRNMAFIMLTLIFTITMKPVYTTKTDIIRIGLLMPEKSYIFSWDLMEPVFDIALDSIHSLYPAFQYKTYYENDKCSEYLAPAKAVELYFKYQVNVFFGPVCSYPAAPVARFTTYWKIPLLTPGALVDAFDVKLGLGSMYSSMTRVSGSYGHLGLFFEQIFKYFEWKPRNHSNVDIFVQQSQDTLGRGKSEEYFVCSGIFKRLSSVGLKSTPRIFPEYANRDILRKNLSDFLSLSKRNARSMHFDFICTNKYADV